MHRLLEYLKPGVFLIFGSIYLIRAGSYPDQAALWPKAIGILILAFSTGWLMEVILKHGQARGKREANEGEGIVHKIGRKQIKALIVCGVSTLLYIVSVGFLGFVISSILYYTILAYLLGTRITVALLIAVSCNVTIYALALAFGIALPRGLLLPWIEHALF